jgi:predicted transcriptional regulator
LEQLAEILFILSSIDRLTLLFEIRSEKRRLTYLTSKLSATPQETSKHLMRLRDARLIEKDSDGFFRLTTLGSIILSMVPGLKFVIKNTNYFLLHDISSLPLEFIERLVKDDNTKQEIALKEYSLGIMDKSLYLLAR